MEKQDPVNDPDISQELYTNLTFTKEEAYAAFHTDRLPVCPWQHDRLGAGIFLPKIFRPR
jgi:hypothetical protein